MGADKSFILLDGKPLIRHVIDWLEPLAMPMIIITNQPEKYAQFALPLFKNVIPDRGSLGGLYLNTDLLHLTHPLPVQRDAQHDIHRLALDFMLLFEVEIQRIQVDDRVNRLQRHDLGGEGLRGHLHTIHLL